MKRFLKKFLIKQLPSLLEEYADEILPHLFNFIKNNTKKGKQSKFYQFLMKQSTKNTIEDVYNFHDKEFKNYHNL